MLRIFEAISFQVWKVLPPSRVDDNIVLCLETEYISRREHAAYHLGKVTRLQA